MEREIVTVKGSTEQAGGEIVLRKEESGFIFVVGGKQEGGAGAGGLRAPGLGR